MPRTTVVVVTWRGRTLFGACLDALAAQTAAHAVLVVDNASQDGTAAVLAAHPSAPRVLRLARNTGYAGGLAAALPHVRTPYMAWLNDDAEPEPSWLASLERVLDDSPDVAAAGSVLLLDGRHDTGAGLPLDRLHDTDAVLPLDGRDDTGAGLLSADGPDGEVVQSAGVRLTGLGYGYDVTAAAPDGVFGFCGGAALLRADALRAVGGMPARFFCYYEDTDTSWRLRLAGHRIVTVPTARVRHRHGASSAIGSRAFHRWNERNRLLMLLRCAPASVAARELARFATITAALPFRRRQSGQAAANHEVPLRLHVLVSVACRLPATLVERAGIGRRAVVSRRELWRRWAGA